MSEWDSPERDAEARRRAVDPAENIVLEASAGTGKTRVLVERYVNLLLAGVDPKHILAITFTRKAAAEMRQRIVGRLRAHSPERDVARQRELRTRLDEIEISTIDAFCLALLREFPLEAGVEPGFDLADETEIPRLVGEALDSALRICRAQAGADDDVALVFAQLGEGRLRKGLAALLDRRLVAPGVLRRFLEQGPRDLTSSAVCARTADRLASVLGGIKGGLDTFLADGPIARAEFTLLVRDISLLAQGRIPLDSRDGCATLRAAIDRLRGYFLTAAGEPRNEHFTGTHFRAADCGSEMAWRRHRTSAAAVAPAVAEAIRGFRRDLNVVLARGVWRVFGVALSQYERTLEAHALLDFPAVLARALELLCQMDEFARSRFRLEARYRHVLVDEFQDTSPAQWELVAQLVRSWSEGLGASTDVIQPSIFIVGDRKQSIYGFRDADPGMLGEAAAFIERLRPEGQPRQAISVSFRAVPALLAFINDIFGEIAARDDTATSAHRRDTFRFEPHDHFVLQPAGEDPATGVGDDVPLGMVVGRSLSEAAELVADEIVRLLSDVVVRDRDTGMRREVRAGDIAILFRSRDSHREFEAALERRGVTTYVYKGLGFFEADEVQDVIALLRFLADPRSNLRAAAFLRSRFVRLSDGGIAALAPDLAQAMVGHEPPLATLTSEDRQVLDQLRAAVPDWLARVDRMPPAELLELVLQETAYSVELGGPRRRQARENLKKLRAFVRRIQNRGYATLSRLVDRLEQLAVGDESNATLDAADAVSLMTVHAAKGLEFPVVFVVNIGRGARGPHEPVRVTLTSADEPSVAIADYQSDGDDNGRAREREETKRLLYVALTRARDRLYLSTVVADGRALAGSGSLGEVLPPSFQKTFADAVAIDRNEPGGRAVISWSKSGGGVPHAFAVIGQETRTAPRARATAGGRASVDVIDDFSVLTDSSVRRMSAVQYAGGDAAAGQRSPHSEDGSSRLIGMLAHRLFESAGNASALHRLRPAEIAGLDRTQDREAVVMRAAELAARLRGHPGVDARLASGQAWYEVPFSVQLDPHTVVRGVIDVLVRGDDGRMAVIELKTGPSRPEHDTQLALYVEAMRRAFPEKAVEGLLVYAAQPGSSP